eukprot:scaffold112527_cov82-Phaeocystis_antarctica.AAC.1
MAGERVLPRRARGALLCGVLHDGCDDARAMVVQHARDQRGYRRHTAVGKTSISDGFEAARQLFKNSRPSATK